MPLWTGEDGDDISLKLLSEYQDYADIFSEEKINVLPKHTEYDHRIDLVQCGDLPRNHIYPLTVRELQVLKEYINDMEQSGKIRRSSSPIGAPILFLPKPDLTLRLYVDYRGLNNITIKNQYPLPLMNELRSRLGKATVFSKLDRNNGYYLTACRNENKGRRLLKVGMAYTNIVSCLLDLVSRHQLSKE